jgi:oligopeptide/dipeptide ABC transporter ATP-binding protein
MNSLDPLQTIRNQAIEIGDVHGYGAQEIEDRLKERFEVMGITPSRITDYPHQFSGGMEQRAIIALSLLLEPSLVIADEPTTALDVIMQDQVMKYLDQMKETAETSVMLVTHDISLVLETCKKMTIMHSGQICESGETVDVFTSPHHPYSALLQQAVPDVRQTSGPLQEIEGTPPLTRNEVNFCTFVDRCPLAVEECRKESPPTEVVGRGEEGTAHVASCFQQDQVEKLKEPERQTVVRNGGEHK